MPLDVPTYCITLPQREVRLRQHLADVLGPDAAAIKYFPAFNGKQLGVRSAHPFLRDHPSSYWAPPLGTGTNPPFFVGPGVLGLCLSVFALVKLGLMLGHKEMLVFEDDVELVPDFVAKYTALRAELPHDFDFLFLGHCCVHQMRPITANLAEGSALCTHAVLYSRKCMEKIEAASKLYTGVDIFFFDDVFPGSRVCYAHPAQLASQLSITNNLPTTLS